jgi:hypothetical protein
MPVDFVDVQFPTQGESETIDISGYEGIVGIYWPASWVTLHEGQKTVTVFDSGGYELKSLIVDTGKAVSFQPHEFAGANSIRFTLSYPQPTNPSIRIALFRN